MSNVIQLIILPLNTAFSGLLKDTLIKYHFYPVLFGHMYQELTGACL